MLNLAKNSQREMGAPNFPKVVGVVECRDFRWLVSSLVSGLCHCVARLRTNHTKRRVMRPWGQVLQDGDGKKERQKSENRWISAGEECEGAHFGTKIACGLIRGNNIVYTAVRQERIRR